MSYEGYDQYMCKNGHHWTRDAYLDYAGLGDETNKCPHCDELPVWEHSVDETNGSFTYSEELNWDEGTAAFGYYEPEEIEPAVPTCDCPNCGFRRDFQAAKYKLPPAHVGRHKTAQEGEK